MSSLAFLMTGAGGPLAGALVEVCRPLNGVPFCRALGPAELDLTSAPAVRALLREWARVVRSDDPAHRLVVVAAAEVGPEAAADDEDAAYALHATAPALLASACAAVDARFVHLSTAEVFAGDRAGGPPYDVDDAPDPRTAYGRTKLAGEEAVRALLPEASWVVRTGDLYGGRVDDAVGRVVARADDGEPVDAASDRVTSPTWSRDLARGLYARAREDAPAGTYHCSSSGAATGVELARAVLEELEADPERVRAGSGRPSYAVLADRSWREAGLPVMPDWRQSLAEALRGRPA